ncbi:MAG: hypothetical protein AAGC46_08860, partial [Solirubrobacteraceae bacterium]|nr:hypothetical protein [Patulibacter sp.]
MQRLATNPEDSTSSTTRRALLGGASVAAAGLMLTRGPIAPAAAAATCEARYPGYQAIDRTKPYAKYMKD